MEQKTKNKARRGIIGFAIIAALAAAVYFSKPSKDPIIDKIKIDPIIMLKPSEREFNMMELQAQVMAMPDCPFKACMITCIAAALGGDIDQLNMILMEYNKMKLQEMKKKGQI